MDVRGDTAITRRTCSCNSKMQPDTAGEGPSGHSPRRCGLRPPLSPNDIVSLNKKVAVTDLDVEQAKGGAYNDLSQSFFPFSGRYNPKPCVLLQLSYSFSAKRRVRQR
jgi:hypothetical protein